jgi:hypothetical protein
MIGARAALLNIVMVDRARNPRIPSTSGHEGTVELAHRWG